MGTERASRGALRQTQSLEKLVFLNYNFQNPQLAGLLGIRVQKGVVSCAVSVGAQAQNEQRGL